MFKRFLRVAGLVGVGIVATAGLAAAAVQTQSQFDNTSAFASFQTGPTFTSISASRGTFEFESDDRHFEQSGTFVNVFRSIPNGFEFGCFNVGDAAFTGGLTGAELHASVGPGTGNCGGKFLGGPSLKGGGGPGFGSGLSSELQIDLVWTPAGPVNRFTSSFTGSCLDLSSSNEFTNNFALASASGTIAGASVTSGGFKFGAQLSTSKGESSREGTPAPGCFFF